MKQAVSAVIVVLSLSCGGGKFVVSDADFWRDGAALGGKYVQLVETQVSQKLAEPASAQFAENCRVAEAKAAARFRSEHPQSKDDGKRLGEKFELNAGCTVRMAFKTE